MPRSLYLNLAVRDLPATITFFRALGFDFNPKFTDQNAACLVINDQTAIMLLTEPFFVGFTDRLPCDTTTHTEAFCALSCDSRAEVDELMSKVIAAGGRDMGRVQEHGFMYGRAFYDLDGHHWEPFWMDPAAE